MKLKNKIKSNAKSVATYKGTTYFIRLGYVIRGILYATIGVFAFISIIGTHESLTQLDVILFINHLPFGYFLTIIFLFGLVGYSLWGFIRASLDKIDRRYKSISFLKRCGFVFSGVVYGSLVIPTSLLLLHRTPKNSSFSNMSSLSHMILSIPFGQFLLVIAGLGGCIGSLLEIYKAITVKKLDALYYDRQSVKIKSFFALLSRFAIGARGVVWLIISVFIIIAAFHANSEEAKSMTDIFSTNTLFPFSAVFISILAFGFILFGVYSCSLAFWMKDVSE